MFYALAGYGARFWKDDLPADMLADVEDYVTAKRFGVQPWEVDEIPEYWINRAPLFEKVLEQAREHLHRKNEKAETE